MNVEQLRAKYADFVKVSDFKVAQANAEQFLGKDALLRLSHTKNKK